MVLLKHPENGTYVSAYFGAKEFELTPHKEEAMQYYEWGVEQKIKESGVAWMVEKVSE